MFNNVKSPKLSRQHEFYCQYSWDMANQYVQRVAKMATTDRDMKIVNYGSGSESIDPVI